MITIQPTREVAPREFKLIPRQGVTETRVIFAMIALDRLTSASCWKAIPDWIATSVNFASTVSQKWCVLYGVDCIECAQGIDHFMGTAFHLAGPLRVEVFVGRVIVGISTISVDSGSQFL